jgi:predicted SAM-dependent methyltransferase
LITATEKQTVLSAGCGRQKTPCHWSFPIDNWREIRVDIDPQWEPDIVADVANMPQIPNESVDAVFMSHCLEHLQRDDAPKAMKEFLRILKPGGGFLTHMPDLQQAASVVADGRGDQFLYQSPGGAITAMDMLFGYQPRVKFSRSMLHQWGYTLVSLHKLMSEAGFNDVKTWIEQWDLWGVGYKL